MIHIEKDWYIEWDEYSYMLFRDTGKTRNDTGGTRKDNCKWYPTIGAALEGYLKICVMQKASKNNYELREAVEMIKTEAERVRGLVSAEEAEKADTGKRSTNKSRNA